MHISPVVSPRAQIWSTPHNRMRIPFFFLTGFSSNLATALSKLQAFFSWQLSGVMQGQRKLKGVYAKMWEKNKTHKCQIPRDSWYILALQSVCCCCSVIQQKYCRSAWIKGTSEIGNRDKRTWITPVCLCVCQREKKILMQSWGNIYS